MYCFTLPKLQDLLSGEGPLEKLVLHIAQNQVHEVQNETLFSLHPIPTHAKSY
jgi:hypothetical protein